MAQNSQIRVMIVDPVALSRKNVCKLLLSVDDIEVVGIARDGSECVRLAKVLEPETILFDPGAAEIDSLQAIRTLTAEAPSAHIILVSANSDTNYLRQAVLAGARSFLANPPKASDLVGAIRRDKGKR
jgi:pilus assembly protein CpaE